VVTETLSWAGQSVGTDEQLAILGVGSTYTSTEGAGAGSVEVTATLIAGADIESEIDYNYSGPGYDYDTGLSNAGEYYTGDVFTGDVGGVPTTTTGAFCLQMMATPIPRPPGCPIR